MKELRDQPINSFPIKNQWQKVWFLNVQTEGANFGKVPSIFRQKSYTLFFSENNFS